MKTNTISKSIIAAIAVAAAILAMSSCSNDSPSAFNAAPHQGFGAVSATNDSTKAKDAPESLPVYAHHVGETVTKHIEGYGDAVFTCISAKNPFYFVHTSDRKYSASEMDAMHYQQNYMAVDMTMFENIANLAANDFAYHYLGTMARAFNGEKLFTVIGSKLYDKEFKKLFHTLMQEENSVALKSFLTDYYWIRSKDHSYPYALFHARTTPEWGGGKYIESDNHYFYATTKDHYLMFAFTEE